MTFRVHGLVLLAIYLGIGAILHGMFYQDQFDWNSALTWGWLLGWPITLFVTFWVVFLAIVVIVIVGALLFAAYDDWKAGKRRKAARQKLNR